MKVKQSGRLLGIPLATAAAMVGALIIGATGIQPTSASATTYSAIGSGGPCPDQVCGENHNQVLL